MKQLFIHINDPSTTFLSAIYSGINADVITRNTMTPNELNKRIMRYDRIVMMGHGSPRGLFDCRGSFVISKDNVEALRDKENIYIWCHANAFVANYGLKGFSTGMFISEVGEAVYCGLSYQPGLGEEIEQSNGLFAEYVGERILESTPTVFNHVRAQYNPTTIETEVVKYNASRLVYF